MQLAGADQVAARRRLVQLDVQPRRQVAPPQTPPWAPSSTASPINSSGPINTAKSGRAAAASRRTLWK